MELTERERERERKGINGNEEEKRKKKETGWDDKDTFGRETKVGTRLPGARGGVNALSQWGRIIVGQGKDGVTQVDKRCDLVEMDFANISDQGIRYLREYHQKFWMVEAGKR